MAVITGTQISDRVGHLLLDTASARWTPAERLLWINDGRREMAEIRPSIFGNGTEVSHTTTSGCRQRLTDSSAYMLVSVDYNVATGKAIRLTTKTQLDAFRPGWRADTGAVVQNWFPDETDALAFWIYPSAPGVDIKCHAHITPTDLASLSDVALPYDLYEPALVNYVMFRAFSKEDEVGSVQKAAAYRELFVSAFKE
jgi:hypothetical protein